MLYHKLHCGGTGRGKICTGGRSPRLPPFEPPLVRKTNGRNNNIDINGGGVLCKFGQLISFAQVS